MNKENELIRSLFHLRKLIFEEAGKSFMDQGLNPLEVMVLFRIKHGPGDQKVSELAREVGVPPSTLTGIMDRLVDKGFIIRERNETDRRVVTVKISCEKMKEIEAQNHMSKRMHEILAEADPGWVDDFTDKLKYLEEKFEDKRVNEKNE